MQVGDGELPGGPEHPCMVGSGGMDLAGVQSGGEQVAQCIVITTLSVEDW